MNWRTCKTIYANLTAFLRYLLFCFSINIQLAFSFNVFSKQTKDRKMGFYGRPIVFGCSLLVINIFSLLTGLIIGL